MYIFTNKFQINIFCFLYNSLWEAYCCVCVFLCVILFAVYADMTQTVPFYKSCAISDKISMSGLSQPSEW